MRGMIGILWCFAVLQALLKKGIALQLLLDKDGEFQIVHLQKLKRTRDLRGEP